MRILGVNITNNLRVEIGLTHIFGIGITRAKFICQQLNIAPAVRIKDLTHENVQDIELFIQKHFQIGSDLYKVIQFNRKGKIDMKCFEGTRLLKRLPLKGRTKCNGKTAKKSLQLKFLKEESTKKTGGFKK